MRDSLDPHSLTQPPPQECGVLGGVLGSDVDMVSFGPNIFGAHSPGGRRSNAARRNGWNLALRRVTTAASLKLTAHLLPPTLLPTSALCAPPPAERLEVSTVQPFWDATLSLLGELAKRR